MKRGEFWRRRRNDRCASARTINWRCKHCPVRRAVFEQDVLMKRLSVLGDFMAARTINLIRGAFAPAIFLVFGPLELDRDNRVSFQEWKCCCSFLIMANELNWSMNCWHKLFRYTPGNTWLNIWMFLNFCFLKCTPKYVNWTVCSKIL